MNEHNRDCNENFFDLTSMQMRFNDVLLEPFMFFLALSVGKLKNPRVSSKKRVYFQNKLLPIPL